MTDTDARPPAREVLAEQAHIMWAHWMMYQFSMCEPCSDGSLLILPHHVERWRRQFNTPYADLTEQERESDREQADRMGAALTAAGYVLLSPKEAEQERDLERLATAAGMRAGR